MIWEYLILAAVLAWAVYYLWRTFFKKKGCSCDTCPAATRQGCVSQGLNDLRRCPEDGEGNEGMSKEEGEKGGKSEGK
ncbi:MAG TPA: FeoB-associated Cys-rich membrane protein [Desulfonatronum sp.]|nr:FeoB-associated Cys-rich membrane protein [Desulfonatronum sp.]